MGLGVGSGLAARPAGRSTPAAATAGHTEAALLDRRREMVLPLRSPLRALLLRHGDNVTDTPVKGLYALPPTWCSA